MKYWEIVAGKLYTAGWSWGYCSAVTRDGWRWIVDAHRGGVRHIVRAEAGTATAIETFCHTGAGRDRRVATRTTRTTISYDAGGRVASLGDALSFSLLKKAK
jgi:hypothetical protein